MPFYFTCPACGHETLASDQFEGRSGPCARCGQQVAVPHGQRRAPSAAPRGEIFSLLLVLGGAAIGVLAALAAWLVGFQLLRPTISGYGATINRGGCQANIKRVGDALLAYHQHYGSFPPAYMADAKGKPEHSWRVLILPFMNQKRLYDRYKFTEPYDGPNNAAILLNMPPEFACPADPHLMGSEMSYRVIVGAGTLFPGTTTKGLNDITDDPATTILLVEMENPRGFGWLNPTDVSESSLSSNLNTGPAGSIISHHPGGVHVMTADGKVHFLPDTTGTDVLQGLATIAGGEALTEEMLAP